MTHWVVRLDRHSLPSLDIDWGTMGMIAIHLSLKRFPHIQCSNAQSHYTLFEILFLLYYRKSEIWEESQEVVE